ncbi:MAG: type II toxin-antitoxin system mRNA interferase toxin, RelE/StbE family [Methanotrichaceae archaeon]|nr:type II toxin-antitoxin system mRNA interferase toxin, RelE/StbE family [Methanotrichaceae archaeon]
MWGNAFRRAFKKSVQQRSNLSLKIENVLHLLEQDPFNPALQSHKLKGKLGNLWACKVDYDCRILFMFLPNSQTGQEDILLVSIGTHQEVY